MKRKDSATRQQQIQIGDTTITYALTFADRKSVGITVRPDQRVDVRAPHGSSLDTVTEIVRKHGAWILRQQAKLAQQPPRPTRVIHGEQASYRWLGRDLPLRVENSARSTRATEAVRQQPDGLVVTTKAPPNPDRVAALLHQWSRMQAQDHFLRRTLELFNHFREYPISAPVVKVRLMRARWGSCSTNGTITLNLKLIHLDEDLIDYVIMHELCHLIEHNHSKRYYALLTRKMPDWKARRQRLHNHGMPE